MSAYLDKSQGVTFVFSNIYQLYQKAKNAKLDEPFTVERQSRVIAQADAIKSNQVKDFRPKILDDQARKFAVPMGVREAEAKAIKQRSQSMDNLRKNLDNLKDAHAKLRFLLKELEEVSKK